MLFIPLALPNQVAAAWVHLALPYARELEDKLPPIYSVNESDESDAGSSEFEDLFTYQTRLTMLNYIKI